MVNWFIPICSTAFFDYLLPVHSMLRVPVHWWFIRQNARLTRSLSKQTTFLLNI